jgi:hypothetical protein
MSDVESSDDEGSFVDEEEDIILDDEDTNSDDISLDEDDDGKGSVTRGDDSAFATVDRSTQALVETDYVILTLNDVVKKQQVGDTTFILTLRQGYGR